MKSNRKRQLLVVVVALIAVVLGVVSSKNKPETPLRLVSMGFDPLVEEYQNADPQLTNFLGGKVVVLVITNTQRSTIRIANVGKTDLRSNNWEFATYNSWQEGPPTGKPGHCFRLHVWVSTNNYPCRLSVQAMRPTPLMEDIRHKIRLAWRSRSIDELRNGRSYGQPETIYTDPILN